MNSWGPDRGFLISDKKKGVLTYCCHPLSGKMMRVAYSGLYPLLDYEFNLQTAEGVLKGGISVEVVKILSNKFNFPVTFIREDDSDVAAVRVSQKHYGKTNTNNSS